MSKITSDPVTYIYSAVVVCGAISWVLKGKKFTKYKLNLDKLVYCFVIPGLWIIFRRLPDLSELSGYLEIIAFFGSVFFTIKPVLVRSPK